MTVPLAMAMAPHGDDSDYGDGDGNGTVNAMVLPLFLILKAVQLRDSQFQNRPGAFDLDRQLC